MFGNSFWVDILFQSIFRACNENNGFTVENWYRASTRPPTILLHQVYSVYCTDTWRLETLKSWFLYYSPIYFRSFFLFVNFVNFFQEVLTVLNLRNSSIFGFFVFIIILGHVSFNSLTIRNTWSFSQTKQNNTKLKSCKRERKKKNEKSVKIFFLLFFCYTFFSVLNRQEWLCCLTFENNKKQNNTFTFVGSFVFDLLWWRWWWWWWRL